MYINIIKMLKKTRGRPKKETTIIKDNIIKDIDNIINFNDNISINSDISDITDNNNLIEIEKDDDDFFLNDFDNTHYIDPVIQQKITTQEKTKDIKGDDNIFNDIIKSKNKNKPLKPIKLNTYEDDNSLYSEKPTQILGKDKRVLLAKIRQYKNLFPDELKKFKIKKNCSSQDLQQYLDEMESIVDVSSVENFLTDSILQCLKLTEGISSYTKYDISGCAEVLKTNKQFNMLVKQLYIKYSVFTAIPPEYSILMLVATTSYFCIGKNKRKGELELYLNKPIEKE